MNCSALLITAMLLSADPEAKPVNAAAKSNTTAEQVRISRCVISAIDDLLIPAQDAGVIASVNVKEDGFATVKEGTLLAVIDDRDAAIKRKQAELEVKEAKEVAESDVKVRTAMKTAEVAKVEWENSIEINKKTPGAVPKNEVRRQELTYQRQILEAEQAEVELRVAALTHLKKEAVVEEVDNALRKRQITAPFAGIVEKIYKRPGEWVTPGEQVIRFVRMDKVRVGGFLKFDEVSPEEVLGQEVNVEVRLPRSGKIEKVKGTVGFVSPVVAGGKYRIWTEVENRQSPTGQWLLSPGTLADVVIDLKPLANGLAAQK